MTFGSLFAGIGGLDLGLERAGMECRWQVEIDPFCQKVLAKHWPDVPRYQDIHDVGAHNLESVDLICGGFPCPVVSQAAAGRNTASWLWPEFSRVVQEARPEWVLIENVEGLLYDGRNFGEILRGLADVGYDVEWDCFPASSIGAPHHRTRVWLVAHANGDSESDEPVDAETPIVPESDWPYWEWPDPPTGLRVADGVPNRTHRLRALGNAVVPQVAEFIGRRIMEAV